jgi:hypothetical protein
VTSHLLDARERRARNLVVADRAVDRDENAGLVCEVSTDRGCLSTTEILTSLALYREVGGVPAGTVEPEPLTWRLIH